jgi:hypothetical protein
MVWYLIGFGYAVALWSTVRFSQFVSDVDRSISDLITPAKEASRTSRGAVHPKTLLSRKTRSVSRVMKSSTTFRV